jgi:hypothetical protein
MTRTAGRPSRRRTRGKAGPTCGNADQGLAANEVTSERWKGRQAALAFGPAVADLTAVQFHRLAVLWAGRAG